MGPLLILIYIKDLPKTFTPFSEVILFSGETRILINNKSRQCSIKPFTAMVSTNGCKENFLHNSKPPSSEVLSIKVDTLRVICRK